jgi:transcriptional regulator of acetoin/glycerol metabolism
MLVDVLILAEPGASPVRERWERAARLGVSATSDAYPTGTNGSDLTHRRERLADVFDGEHAILEPLAAQLAARELVAIVADPDGVILASRGGCGLVDPAARVRLVEGARWSEEARGTNAIGTAIVEKRPVAVIGDAHFEVRNKSLFCYATPVRDAFGALVAVLDVTGPVRAHDPAVGMAVHAAGAALEQTLRAAAYARAGVGAISAIERLVHRCLDPALVVEASGVVGEINDAARAALHVLERALTCERLFGVPYAELELLAAQGARGMRFEARGVTYRVELDPIAGAPGRALGIVVHLERERSASPIERRSSSPSAAAAAQVPPAFARILACDEGVARAIEQAACFATTSLPVLLLAETGTGKELFARAIHDASPYAISHGRAPAPFVAVNCGALAPSLLEAEIFGYAPGAFTGASRGGSEGRLGAAHGGTLFLDEIAEMPDALQAALLRVLDDGVYSRVGESRPRRAAFRLVCATCRDLPELVDRGVFRRDLFYRIHGGCVTIPALRERTDRVWLASALLAELTPHPPRLAADARRWIATHDWPGNVRELKSALAHALALAGAAPEIEERHFPRVLLRSTVAPRTDGGVQTTRGDRARTREQILRDAVGETVAACEGNLSEAARRLGVARSTLYRSLRRGS